jgi:hypothetical protein
LNIILQEIKVPKWLRQRKVQRMSAFFGLRWKRERSQELILFGQNILLNKLYIIYSYFFLEYGLKYRLWLLRNSSLYSWRSETEFWPLFGGYLQSLKQWSDSIYSHIDPLRKSLLIHKSYLCRHWLASIIDKTLLHSFFWVIPRHLNFMCRRFGTLRLFRLQRWCEEEEFFLFTQHIRIEGSVPKGWHIKFRRRRIIQKKEYDIHNKRKVWNQKPC